MKFQSRAGLLCVATSIVFVVVTAPANAARPAIKGQSARHGYIGGSPTSSANGKRQVGREPPAVGFQLCDRPWPCTVSLHHAEGLADDGIAVSAGPARRFRVRTREPGAQHGDR